MEKAYLTFFQLIFSDKKLYEAFNKFLMCMCFKHGLGPKHLKPLIDKECGQITDQVACIFDYLQSETKRCINAEFCGYGKSYIDSFITVCLIKFFKIHNLKEKNGGRPLTIVKTAPLTSLSNGNQLEKDIQYIFPLMKENFANIKLINNCSGSEATRMNEYDQNVILETIINDNNYPVEEHKKIKRLFSNCIEKISDIDVDALLNDNDIDIDVIIIYTCDKSLGKLNKFPDNSFDLASFDEAHVHFLNGGRNKNIEEENIFNSLVKFIDKNPECVCRFFTATPMYLNGSDKSTWNRPLFGEEKVYLTYTRAIEIGRALPIYVWIFKSFVKDEYVSYDEFMRMKEENQVKYIANVAVLCNKQYHLIDDTEKYSRSLIKTDRKYFRNLYKMNEKFKECKAMGKTFNSDDVKKIFKDDKYYQYLNEGGIIVASTSGDGVIILTNDFNKNKEFNNVPELVNFLKDKKNCDEYTNHDMLIFNIRQLSTGHDINIFNNTIILCKCEADDFQQCIFRSGRLNGIKKKNVVFLVDSVVDNETIQYYCEILDRLATKIGAFDGHISVEWKGDGSNIDEDNVAWIYIKNLKMQILEKNYKCIDSNKLINAKTGRDKFYNEWRVLSDENGFLDYKESIKSKEEYEAFKDKICMMYYNEINSKMIQGREYKTI